MPYRIDFMPSIDFNMKRCKTMLHNRKFFCLEYKKLWYFGIQYDQNSFNVVRKISKTWIFTNSYIFLSHFSCVSEWESDRGSFVIKVMRKRNRKTNNEKEIKSEVVHIAIFNEVYQHCSYYFGPFTIDNFVYCKFKRQLLHYRS